MNLAVGEDFNTPWDRVPDLLLPAYGETWLMVGITRDSRDPFALKTVQLPVSPISLRFPVSLRSLVVRGDEDAWRTVRGLVVEPIAVEPRGSRLTADLARRAVRYGSVTMYFLDDRSFPEPQAFWIGGARDATVKHCVAGHNLRSGLSFE